MSATPASEMSKSARQRANKKARDEEAAAAEAAAAAPAPKAKGKAKAEPKAKAEAAAPKAEAKAAAKGKAKAEPAPAKAKAAAPAPAPAVAEPKPKAKSEAKAKAKGKAKPEKEAAPPPPPADVMTLNYEMDDGQGGEWEVSTGLDKKQAQQKRKQDEKKQQEIDEAKALKAAGMTGKHAGQSIPGMASAADLAKATKAGAKDTAGMTHVAKAAAAIAKVTADAALAKANALKNPAAAAPGAPAPEPLDPNQIATCVKIDPAKIGRIIGPKGATIALIKDKTGVKTIDTAGDLCTIVGLPDQVAAAEHAIRELNDKGYMSLSFDDFKDDHVMIPTTSIPDIIGSRGAIIIVIKDTCKVEIDIPPTPKTDKPQPGKKVKVSIAGGAEGVKQAIEIINSIVQYSHHEVTHPGFAHAEMEVEEWKYRFLIGKGGCEMRHIQNNYKVKVNIPRDTSVSDKVTIVGQQQDVERCVKYIEKILLEADQAPKAREEPKAEDNWGDEGPEEAWMGAYMYKR